MNINCLILLLQVSSHLLYYFVKFQSFVTQANHTINMTSPKAVFRAAVKVLGKDMTLSTSLRYPTVFSIPEISVNDFNFESYSAQKTQLFTAHSLQFIQPKDLKFQLPKAKKPEVAFIGRSNVGKSSLIEALTGDHRVVRVSKTPGCTTTLNFLAFVAHQHLKHASIDNHRAYLVDMPGYGYAKRSREEQQRWLQVMDGYLTTRDQFTLRRIFLLIDSRHGIKESDMDMMEMLNQHRTPYQLVFTKSDLSSNDEAHNNIKNALAFLQQLKNCTALPYVHLVSSEKKPGIDTLQLAITEILCSKEYSALLENSNIAS